MVTRPDADGTFPDLLMYMKAYIPMPNAAHELSQAFAGEPAEGE